VTATTENTDYRRNENTSFPDRRPLTSRFQYYANTIYYDDIDSMGVEKFKSFSQQWMTSKLWPTSKLLNKYYILIQNTVLLFLDKIKRIDSLHFSSITRLTNFHFFAKFCSNIATYTVAHDEAGDFAPNVKEEDSVANLMMYELMRMYGDRVHRASQRSQILQKLVECCRSEFIGKSNITAQSVDQLTLGNFHNRREAAFVKLSLVSKEEAKVAKESIISKLRDSTNNHLLEGILHTPHCLREVFKLSRLLFKEMQHAILIGPPGCGKTEYL
jgi:hypothetical protein